jgi:hypothetical protein
VQPVNRVNAERALLRSELLEDSIFWELVLLVV